MRAIAKQLGRAGITATVSRSGATHTPAIERATSDPEARQADAEGLPDQAPRRARGRGQPDPVPQLRRVELDHRTDNSGQRRLFVLNVVMMESSVKYETIILDRKDGIGYLTLNRPERANTISLQLMNDVVNAMEEVETDPGVSSRHRYGCREAFLRRRRPTRFRGARPAAGVEQRRATGRRRLCVTATRHL